jgi:hypothetical protein
MSNYPCPTSRVFYFFFGRCRFSHKARFRAIPRSVSDSFRFRAIVRYSSTSSFSSSGETASVIRADQSARYSWLSPTVRSVKFLSSGFRATFLRPVHSSSNSESVPSRGSRRQSRRRAGSQNQSAVSSPRLLERSLVRVVHVPSYFTYYLTFPFIDIITFLHRVL